MEHIFPEAALIEKKEVAIIGIAGLFPGSSDLNSLIEQLKSGKDCVRNLSNNRLIDAGCNLEKNYKPVGYLEEVDKFDYSFFGISKSEAEAIDPVQRLLLEMTYTAFEDSGIGPENFQAEKINIYVGGLGSNYHVLSKMDSAVSVIGNTNGIIAGRIAYALDLRGSAIMLDTTCSSALTAIHEAYRHLVNGDTKLAVAGSVNVQLFFAETNEFSPLNTMSEDGRCKPFDARANGIGSGEGGGVVIMKNLSDAIRDGDHIYAVIKGGATNSDGGLSNGLTAPSPEAQKNVILEAWKDAGIDPGTLGYIEAHGTGTKLGDPIEFQALTEAFRFHKVPDKSCALGAVKSNFGHLDHAAGMAGLFKIFGSFKSGKFFPTLHFQQPNPFLDYANSALYVNTLYKDWNLTNGPRRAAISAFGLSGTNVHLVLEEFINNDPPSHSQIENKLWLKVSAKTPQVLKAYCTNILSSLKAANKKDIPDLLQTLNSSRGNYDYIFTTSANNLSDLIYQLENSEPYFFRKKMAGGVTVLLSDDVLEEQYINFFEELDADVKRIRQVILETYQESWAKVIASQLAMLVFLNFLGIKFSRIVAGGLGRISQRIYNDTTLVYEIRRFIEEGIHLAAIDNAKLTDALSNILATEINPVFIAATPSCKLLNQVKQINVNLEMGSLSAHHPDSPGLNPFFEFCCRQGLILNLKTYGVKAGYNVFPAPTYPFQKTRCWFDTQSKAESVKAPDFLEKLYTEEFTADLSQLPYLSGDQKVIVAFTQDADFSNRVIQELSKQNEVILVHASLKYNKVSKNHYEIVKENPNEFVDLFDDLKSSYTSLSGILLDWGYQIPYRKDGFCHADLLVNYYIAKAFKSALQERHFGVYIAVKGLFDTDFHYQNPQAANWGFWKGILSDHPWLDMHLIDFASKNYPEVDAISFIKEIGTEFPIKVARYESQTRLISLIRPHEVESTSINHTIKGNYLITGGLGKIGRALCLNLAPKAKSLIILGRSDYMQDEEKTKLVEELRKCGTNVDYYQIDIAQEAEMAVLLDEINHKYKHLHSIYHLAGNADDFVPLEKKTIQGFERTIAPKITGTILLKKFSDLLKPEFFIIFSSLNAILPKKNSFDYAAANAFEDFLPFKIPMQGHTRYISINWPGWDVFQEEILNKSALNVQNGIAILSAIESAGRPNLIVSTPADLNRFRINPFFSIYADESTDSGNVEKLPLVFDVQEDVPVEDLIKQIWKDVLKSDDIDLEDDFFDIGGHSLNGTQVLNRIYKNFGVDIDMDDFFDHGTLKGQSDLVKSRLENQQANILPINPASSPILPLPVQEDYETSDIQKTFWMNSQLQQDSRIYNLVFPFFIKGKLNQPAIEKTLQFLLDRHESLRSGFRIVEGEIRQFIRAVTCHDLNIRYEQAEEGRNWDAYAQDEHDDFFDLNADLLIKIRIVSYREDYHLLVLTLHHLNADGWSHGVLLRDFIIAYKAYISGKDPDLKPLNFHYKDYVIWLNNLISAKENEDVIYWKDKLYGQWPMLEIPDGLEELGGRWTAGTLKITISHLNTLKLKALSKQHDATLFMMLVAISKVLIYQSFGWNDIVIGTVTSGRIRPELENQIGNYLNTIALRDYVHADMSFQDVLIEVRQTVLEAFRHQNYPFARIIDQRLHEGAEWRDRWLDVQVNLHNYQRVEDYLKNEAELFEVPQESTDYDHDTDWNLHLNCLELEKDVLSIYLNYSKLLFAETSMESLQSNLLSLIELILINPAIGIGKLAASLPGQVILKQNKKETI